MSNIQRTVFVVDDDDLARESVCALVSSMGSRVLGFRSSEEFLSRYEPGARGCVVTDVRMPGMSGLELQQELAARDIPLPIIVLTAYARTPMTVRAIKAGAVTLLEKPYADDDLWEAIREALNQESELFARSQRVRAIRQRVARLTDGDRELIAMIAQGKPNKVIAAELDVSLRTVEHRRHLLLAKLEVQSVAELIRLAVEAGLVGGVESGEWGAGREESRERGEGTAETRRRGDD